MILARNLIRFMIVWMSFSCVDLALAVVFDAPANYELDHSRKRTTGMVKDGTLSMEITDYLPDHEDGPMYRTQLSFELDIKMAGKQSGEERILIDEAYFTPEFWTELRAEKYAELTNFKIKHLGIADASTLGGAVYEDCDKVFLYDIQVDGSTFLRDLFKNISDDAGDFKDMKLGAYVCSEISGFGAAKLDISGKTRGFNFKIGFDLKNELE